MSAEAAVAMRDYNGRLHEFVLTDGFLRWYFTRVGAGRGGVPDASFNIEVFRNDVHQLGKGRASSEGGVYRLRRSNDYVGIPSPVYRDTMYWFRYEEWAALEKLLAQHIRKVVSV